MKNRDMAIAEAVLDSLKEVVWDTDSDDRNGVMIDMDEVDLAAIIASVPVDVEPVAWQVEVRGSDTDWRRYAIYESKGAADRTCAKIAGEPLDVRNMPLYTAPHDAASIRRAAIEECAKVCDNRIGRVSNGNGISYQSFAPTDVEASYCAEHIRALLDKEPATEGAEK